MVLLFLISNVAFDSLRSIAPLDLYNRVGLITHEVFYALTSDQGDLDSNRARMINATFWGFKTYPNYEDQLRTIGGHPAETLAKAYLLSEVPQGQEIEIEQQIQFPQKDTYALSPDTGLLPYTEWFFNFDHKDHSYVQLYNRNNQFDAGSSLPKGLRLKITHVETRLMANWIQTILYFKTPSGFPNEIDRMFVRGPAEGKYPITVSDFENTIKGYFKLVK